MNPSGQGDLPAGAAAIEETIEEKQRSELDITTRQEKHTELPSNSEKQPSTPVPASPTSPTGIAPSPHSSSSEIGADITKYDSKIVQVRQVPEGDDALAHLPEHERQALRRQLYTPDVSVTYTSLYRYATTWDIVFIVIAALMAIGGGAVQPLMTVVFGNLSGSFQGLFLGTLDQHGFNSTLNRYVLYFVYLAIGEFCLVYISTVLFIYTGEHITAKVREQYLRAILRQNIGYFDKLGAGEVTTRITSDTNLVQEAISEKVGLTLLGVAAFFSAFIIGFVKFWKLTLICMSTVVAIVLIMGVGGRKMAAWNKKSLASYAVGGSVAEEVLASIRNAVAFGTQDKLAKQYNVHLLEARRWGFRSKSTLGCMIGGLLCILFLNYGLAFWMGSRFLVGGETNLSHILTIILAVMIGAFAFGNVGPNMQHFAAGVAAAAKIYSTIDRESPLDPLSESGERLEHVEGTVELRNVKHIYPSRPEVVVMEDVSLVIPAGKTTALVGASGSGKSTIVGLVERFYDPVGGTILLDGHDISTLNLHWLRQQISLVQQEPILFSQTIRDNIRNGLIGSKYENEPEEQQTLRIIEAARKANAHDFISSLPEGYDTHVGERGFLLSGGQKQRVAIARAIVSDPKILLLDEATSALDTKSEGVVQQALDEAAKGRTTIVIAHRLSTIRTADNIVVMQNGRIIEQGTHEELLALRKAYYSLVSAQRIGSEDEAESEKDTETSEEDLTRIQSSRSGSAAGMAPEDLKLALGRTKSQKSISSRVLADQKPEGNAKYSLWPLFKFMLGFNRSEWHIMCVGFVFTCIAGAAQPVQGIFFAKSIVALSRPLSQRHQIRHDIDFWALMYLMLAFVDLLAMVIQGVAFAFCSESLIQRARDGAFRRFLRQDISFFDEDENSTGALTSFLSTEATHLASLSGATLGTLLSCATTLVVSIVIALAIGWKLALVCMCALPVILGTGFFRFYILAKFTATAQKSYEKSAGYACEHTNAIRTVASLTTEQRVFEEYRNQLTTQLRLSLKSNMRNSSLYAASQSAMFLAFALGFWYGGKVMARGEYSMFQFFIVFTEIIFGAQSAGTVFSFAGDMSHAKNAAAALKRLYDRKPTIDPWSEDGEHVTEVEGNIEFRDVHFRYPTRPDVPVLRGLNLTVKAGQYVALVGASGKSSHAHKASRI